MVYIRGILKCFNCGNLWNFYFSGGSFVPKYGLLCDICTKDQHDKHLERIYSSSFK